MAELQSFLANPADDFLLSDEDLRQAQLRLQAISPVELWRDPQQTYLDRILSVRKNRLWQPWVEEQREQHQTAATPWLPSWREMTAVPTSLNPHRLRKPMPFAKLVAEAKRLNADPRLLIARLNRHFFGPERGEYYIPEEYWSGPDYPIYIETDYDVGLMKHYRDRARAHRRIGSLGWWAHYARKDPRQYHSLDEFADKIGIQTAKLRKLEHNKWAQSPGITAFRGLFRSVPHIDEQIWVDANNTTYNRRLPLAELFPNVPILVTKSGQERDRLIYIINSKMVTTLSGYLFAARHLQPGHPTVAEIAERLNVPSSFVTERELEQVPLTVDHLPAWWWLWRFYDLPDDLFKVCVSRSTGLPESDPLWQQLESAVKRPDIPRGSGRSVVHIDDSRPLPPGVRRLSSPSHIETNKKLRSSLLAFITSFDPDVTAMKIPQRDEFVTAKDKNVSSFHVALVKTDVAGRKTGERRVFLIKHFYGYLQRYNLDYILQDIEALLEVSPVNPKAALILFADNPVKSPPLEGLVKGVQNLVEARDQQTPDIILVWAKLLGDRRRSFFSDFLYLSKPDPS